MRDLLLFLHILGAAVWIGVATFAYYYFAQAAKAGGGEPGRSMKFFMDKVRAYGIVVVPLVVLSGVGLVLTEDQWSWSDTFVWVGIGAVVATGIWDGAYSRKRDEALVEAVAEDAHNRPALRRRWIQTFWVEIAFLLVALWAMVTKLP